MKNRSRVAFLLECLALYTPRPKLPSHDSHDDYWHLTLRDSRLRWGSQFCVQAQLLPLGLTACSLMGNDDSEYIV